MKSLVSPEVSGVTIFIPTEGWWVAVAVYLLAVNLLAFALMGIDKWKSKREGARRIRERTLFLWAVLGGSVGAILGMRVFHHKTKHWYFNWGMPLILVLQVALAIFLVVKF